MGDGISGPAVDLFGEPVRPERGRGRPEHVWTVENSNKVNLLFACGHDVKDVAAALRVSVPTLRKHYFAEVEARRHARLRLRAVQLDRLNRQAEAGNVAAEKALAAMVQAEQLQAASVKVAARGKTPEKPMAALGKKEAARHAAHEVEGRFGPRTPPPSLIN